METAVKIVLTSSLIAVVIAAPVAHPKNAQQTDVYRNQHLPEIPGYIPVYIKQEQPHYKSEPVKNKSKTKVVLTKTKDKVDSDKRTQKSHQTIQVFAGDQHSGQAHHRPEHHGHRPEHNRPQQQHHEHNNRPHEQVNPHEIQEHRPDHHNHGYQEHNPLGHRPPDSHPHPHHPHQ